jgi:hypothetical protein
MLLLEHCDEGPELGPAEAHASRLQRAAEVEREIPVASGDARASGGCCGKVADDVAWNGDELAVEVDLDRSLLHRLLYGPELDACNLFRGLKA